MVLGRSIRRLEDRPLLTGQGRFAADISFPGQLHMRVVRSPVAFGRLGTIEVDEALAMAGVVAVWTCRDVATVPPIDFRQVRVPGLGPYRQRVLAQDYVRYVGEPLAVVFADDPYLAEDAAELVFADIEELAPCLDAGGEPTAFLPGIGSEAAIVEKAYGDLESAFAGAHAIVELKLAVGRHSGVPLETRGAIARYDPARGVLELHGAAKIPHINRRVIAKMLGLPLERVHLYEGHVGGGFGIRGELYPEDVLVCLAALRFERPVKWIEDRREHLLAANHARDQIHRIRAAVDAQGFILGIDDEFWTDQGAYVRTHAATVTDLAAAILPGPYLIPAYRSRGHIRLTNKTPSGTYRAPGRFEGTFVRERLLDAIAARLQVDPLDVRRVNLIGPEAMPFARGLDALGTEIVYDSGDYPRLLDHLLERISHADLERHLELRRSRGEKVGFGLAIFVEKSGLGPFDDARVLLQADGGVEVVTGAASVGQGIETALAQICAAALGIEPGAIRVTHGRTDRIEDGMGAFASRATVMTGSAVHLAASELRRRLLATAGRLLQAAPDDLTLEDGRIRRGDAGPSLGIADVARELALQTGARQAAPAETGAERRCLRGTEPASSGAGWAAPARTAPSAEGVDRIGLDGTEGCQAGDVAPPGVVLSADARFTTAHMTYPYGITAAVVRVDAATGGVAIERLWVAYDVGRAVNPMLIEAQIAGGVLQGIGGALLEEFLYDPGGQPLAASFADYLLPGLGDAPPVDVLLTEEAPSPLNPLGVKGAGEGGINAVGAALAGAIDAALGSPGAVDRLPVTSERLYRLARGHKP
jgi:CO/xanthine dehydrogenase Mo-binding subunit